MFISNSVKSDSPFFLSLDRVDVSCRPQALIPLRHFLRASFPHQFPLMAPCLYLQCWTLGLVFIEAVSLCCSQQRASDGSMIRTDVREILIPLVIQVLLVSCCLIPFIYLAASSPPNVSFLDCFDEYSFVETRVEVSGGE